MVVPLSVLRRPFLMPEERPYLSISKTELRKAMKAERIAHVAALDKNIRGLLFSRPPAALAEKIAPDAVIGLYHASEHEAPTRAYAKFFQEAGHAIALPRFSNKQAAMEFAAYSDPFDDSDLERGAFGMMQPAADAEVVHPDIVFVPLMAFTDRGERLGQGGGHYDRWLSAHSVKAAIGLAWDVQRVEQLPMEAHDRLLDAVVTPTRAYGPFDRSAA